MTDQRTDEMTADLPEGTDTVIEGAASTGEDSAENTTAREDSERGLVERIRGGREQLSNQAGERARALSPRAWTVRPKRSPMFPR